MAWLLTIQIVGVTAKAASHARDGVTRGLNSIRELIRLMRSTAMLNRQRDRNPVLREISFCQCQN